LKLSDLKGKVLLIVNTASKCGFTPQYAELEQLYKSYKERGFEILDFPCNQFGGQSPESDEETTQFCQLNYGTTFPQLKKIEVNGECATPLYKWLKSEKGFAGFDEGHPIGEKLHEILSAANPDYAKSSDIKWNFTKFLIDREGKVVARFEPTTDLKRVAEAIEALL
jgi:glutathione peroxidase